MNLRNAEKKVDEQFELYVYGCTVPDNIRSLVDIVIEVYCLNKTGSISINGESIKNEMVQRVYERAVLEDLETVSKIYQSRTDVKHPKNFIRALIYNTIMEKWL